MELTTQPVIYHMGTSIVKFNLPMKLIDDINKSYDEKLKELQAHNEHLAGKIKEEKKVNEILTLSNKDTFLWCFEQYVKLTQQPKWNCVPTQAWINEMKAGAYNPTHYHSKYLHYCFYHNFYFLLAGC